MSRKYKFRNEQGVYFVSTTVVNFIDVFTRRLYKDIIISSLEFCQNSKGLIVYAYVIMSNHLHLIIGKDPGVENNFSEIIRDFKKYTAMQVIKAISENMQESRRDWLLRIFENAGKMKSNNTRYQFWQQHNKNIELENDMIEQKLDYIHHNPVEAGWVSEPHEYYYSSARNYSGLENPLKIYSVFDGNLI